MAVIVRITAVAVLMTIVVRVIMSTATAMPVIVTVPESTHTRLLYSRSPCGRAFPHRYWAL